MKLHISEENSKYGYRDENETIVIPAKYEEAKDFKEEHAVVKYNGFNHDEENYGDGGNDWNDNGSLMDALDGEPDAYWNID